MSIGNGAVCGHSDHYVYQFVYVFVEIYWTQCLISLSYSWSSCTLRFKNSIAANICTYMYFLFFFSLIYLCVFLYDTFLRNCGCSCLDLFQRDNLELKGAWFCQELVNECTPFILSCFTIKIKCNQLKYKLE